MKHLYLGFISLLFCSAGCIMPTFADSDRVAEIVERMQESNVSTIDFMFTDILGSVKNVLVPFNQLERCLKNGLKFDGSSIPGYSTIYESDMHLMPDLASAQVIVDYDGYATGRVMCDVYKNAQEPYEGDPRSILKSLVNRVNELGYEFYVGPELEFFLFAKGPNKSVEPIDYDRYFDAEQCSQKEQYKRELLECLLANGVRVEKLHHEVAPGQHEISMHYADALTMADQIVLAKHVIAQFADSIGMKASFMPKPISNQNGSGMHIHFSLAHRLSHPQNAFYDAHDETHLSDIARQFIAGVLNYVPQVNAFINPTVNSYKRLVAGFEAPVYVCWGTKNRSALVRIPEINIDEQSAARAELRSPDAMANPYILLSILLAAGLEGIENTMMLAPAINENLYKLSLDQIRSRGIATLPACLTHALQDLQESDFAVRALGQRLVNEFIALKKKEVAQYASCITNWEIEHYL